MRVRAAIICDYAEVRENLLTVISGGLTRIWRTALPAPIGISIALLLEATAEDRSRPHELSVEITGPEGRILGQVRGGVQISPGGDYDADESGVVPVPLDLRNAQITHFGWHEIAIAIDGRPEDALRIKVVQGAGPHAQAAMPVIPTGTGKPN